VICRNFLKHDSLRSNVVLPVSVCIVVIPLSLTVEAVYVNSKLETIVI